MGTYRLDHFPCFSFVFYLALENTKLNLELHTIDCCLSSKLLHKQNKICELLLWTKIPQNDSMKIAYTQKKNRERESDQLLVMTCFPNPVQEKTRYTVGLSEQLRHQFSKRGRPCDPNSKPFLQEYQDVSCPFSLY